MDTTTQPAPAEAPTRDGLWPMPPGPPHEERHFTQHEAVRDIIAGAAEGPAVPFAVAAGLVAAGASAGLVVAGPSQRWSSGENTSRITVSSRPWRKKR